MPMTTVEVDSNTASILQTLKAKAEAQGIPLYTILAPLAAQSDNGAQEKPLYETLPPAQLAEAFVHWADSHLSGLGLTLEDVSRESIYEE